MKTLTILTLKTILRVIAVIVLFKSGSARADLINLNPGGYDYSAHNFQPPQSLLDLIHRLNLNEIALFDAASPSGWAGTGELPGGTFFFTDLITNGAEPFATVNWDLDSLPGYSMQFLDVVGTLNGDPWETVWLATGATTIDSNGDLLVTLNGTVDISSIAFYGRTPTTEIPDSGSTVALMGLGILGLFWMRKAVI